MANFVLLYSGGSMPETQAEQAEVMQAWGAWFGKIGSALVDGGNPFTPVAKTVSKDGKVTDGPVGTLAGPQVPTPCPAGIPAWAGAIRRGVQRGRGRGRGRHRRGGRLR